MMHKNLRASGCLRLVLSLNKSLSWVRESSGVNESTFYGPMAVMSRLILKSGKRLFPENNFLEVLEKSNFCSKIESENQNLFSTRLTPFLTFAGATEKEKGLTQ